MRQAWDDVASQRLEDCERAEQVAGYFLQDGNINQAVRLFNNAILAGDYPPFAEDAYTILGLIKDPSKRLGLIEGLS